VRFLRSMRDKDFREIPLRQNRLRQLAKRCNLETPQ
jgi:hypothetical protein